jgi:hypothetical protein
MRRYGRKPHNLFLDRRLYSCIHDVGAEQDAHDHDVDIKLPPKAEMDLLWWSEAMLRSNFGSETRKC